MSDRRFEVTESFRFIGRTFEEYVRMFDLDPASLSGTRVLDCPGGPGAFTAVASTLGAQSVAVDPVCGPSADELGPTCVDAVDRTVEQLRADRDLFVWDEYGGPENRGRYLRAAAERFLADYACHPGRYLPAALPHLPFRDDAFDLALSGNLLFLYDDRLDHPFHRAALVELRRVAREVRVFPLASLNRERSALVNSLAEEIRDEGIEVAFHETDYEFQPGATELLVLSARDDRDS